MSTATTDQAVGAYNARVLAMLTVACGLRPRVTPKVLPASPATGDDCARQLAPTPANPPLVAVESGDPRTVTHGGPGTIEQATG